MDRTQKVDPILLNGTGMRNRQIVIGSDGQTEQKKLFAKAGIPAAFTPLKAASASCLFRPRRQLLSLNQGVLRHLSNCSGNGKALKPEWYPYPLG